jgi:hypothetical protein
LTEEDFKKPELPVGTANKPCWLRIFSLKLLNWG